jgi:uncharacterized protein YqjF (DUF2071 family)
MRLGEMTGRIRHRILLNYRIDPVVAQRVLPPGFRPKVVDGAAVGGVCQVSLERMRPRGLPAAFGVSSHNAAHRIAVVLDGPDGPREGVYIPRRDTSSTVNALAGGRLFPGTYRLAHFAVDTRGDRYRVAVEEPTPDAAAAARPILRIDATLADALAPGSVFPTVADASHFFEGGSLGWSPSSEPGRFDEIELRTVNWRMQPLAVQEESSAFFGDPAFFPPGSVELDCALVMRDLEHSWLARAEVCTVCA